MSNTVSIAHLAKDQAILLSLGIMIEACTVQCPYCGEQFETDVDCSGGSQSYYEDCFVCCRPILFEAVVDDGELVSLGTRRDDE